MLSIPTRRGVTDALRNYFRAELPDLDPSTERRSLIGALVKSLGSALADWYITLKRWVDREPFPQSASESGTLFSGWWNALTKLERNPASPAHGFAVFTGDSGATVPADMTIVAGAVAYKTRSSATIVAQPLAAALLSVVDGKARFQTSQPHYLASGMSVTVSGASPSTYNGVHPITVTGDDAFTYEPPTLPGATATGSPIATSTSVAIEVQSTTTGKLTNLDGGSTFAISSAPSGVSGTAFATFGGIQGGADIESADAFRARTLKALGTDYGMFTADEIEIIAKQIPGVTKVMIRKAMIDPPEGWPHEGQVKIAFLRGNDADILPTAQAVSDVKNHIIALAMPAHTASEDVIVMSPVAYYVDIVISAMSPDTPSMRRAVRAQMEQFFREGVEWGVAIELIAIQCALRDTVDAETRTRLKTFTLDSPSGAVDPGVDGFPILRSISFPT